MRTKCPKCLSEWTADQRVIIKKKSTCPTCRGLNIRNELQNLVDNRLKMYSDRQYGKGVLKEILKQL